MLDMANDPTVTHSEERVAMHQTFAFSKEMGSPKAEILRQLHAFARSEDTSLVVNGNSTKLRVSGGSVAITFRKRPARRLGSLRIPSTDVEFAFAEVAEKAAKAFKTRFENSVLRIGG